MLETKEESIEYLINLLKQIKQTHSYKKFKNPNIQTKLTKEDKIKFALNYHDTFQNTSLIEVLQQYGFQNKELKNLTIEFMTKYNLLIPYPNSRYEYVKTYTSKPEYSEFRTRHLSIKETVREYNYDNWLEPFNEDSLFAETKTKHPSYHVYLDNNNNPIKFDKDHASKVKLAIVEQKITPARCIVEGAYPYEAKENLEGYISYIKSLRR